MHRLHAEHRSDRRAPFHVRIQALEHAVNVAASERVKATAQRLHVLLRHRPRSISLKPLGTHCQGRQEEWHSPTWEWPSNFLAIVNCVVLPSHRGHGVQGYRVNLVTYRKPLD